MNTTTLLVRAAFAGTLLTMTLLPYAGSAHHGAHPAAFGDADCMPKYPPAPTVKIMVRVPACSEPGGTIKYCICIENCSTAEAHHVVVKNTLPENARFVKSDPPPSAPPHGEGKAVKGELHWNLGTVGGGARREIILVLQPTNREDVKNCARVQFEHGQCVTTRQTLSPHGGPPHGVRPDGSRPPIITTVPDAASALDLKVEGPATQYANLPAEYRIWVTNTGKTKTVNTQVRALLPEKLKVTLVGKPGVEAKNLVEWRLGDLEPGAKRLVELTVRALEKGEHCLQIVADADGGIKTEKQICTNFAGASAMTIEMFDKEDPVFVGAKTSYPVVIKNQGGQPLTAVRLKAFVPGNLRYERANAHAEPQAPLQGGQWIEFPVLPPIPPGQEAKYEVFVEATQAGIAIFRVEVTADQIEVGRPVIEEESTTVVDDREKIKIRDVSRLRY